MMVIDESHQTIPQVRGMYNGDQSRKRTLVEYGFRLAFGAWTIARSTLKNSKRASGSRSTFRPRRAL